jgi:hypothetical protein
MSILLDDFDSIIRDFKIRSILGEFYIEPDINSLKMGNNFLFTTKHWKIIQKYKKECIVSGSCSLKAFGLLERSPRDLDLILLDESKLNIFDIDKLSRDGYYTIEVIGSTLEKKIRIDFFKFTNQSIIEVNGIKFHNPLEILKLKRNTIDSNKRIPTKHFEDIFFSLKKLMPEKFKESYLDLTD